MIRLSVLFCLVASVLGDGNDGNTLTIAQPQPCGDNEVYSEAKIVCPPQSCESIYTTYMCAQVEPRPGCNCIDGYLRDASHKCIPSDQCPIPGGPVKPQACNGDPNAEYRECTGCQRSCDNTIRYCTAMCRPPGCQCKNGYVLHKGRCILPEQCPGCNGDPNAIKKPCPNPCPATCAKSKPGPCTKMCVKEGCQCKPGYVLHEGKCISPKQCPVQCPIEPKCRRTCAVPNPKNCPSVPLPSSNEDACQCQQGYILTEPEGTCIKVEDCPGQQTCNGDPNAILVATPWACPPTCANPNAAKCPQGVLSTPGCNCKSGYLFNKKGKCILPKHCPGGNPCGKHRTIVDCDFPCPGDYCPQEFPFACKPPRPCPPGCGCKPKYKKVSLKNPTCVLEKNCPPVKCSNPNEVWSKCPSDCLAESCDNVNDPPPVCGTPAYCKPKCICKQGFFRDSTGTCIPAYDCPGYIVDDYYYDYYYY